jgi:hypothetical protein
VGAERRVESGSSSGGRRRFRFRSTAAIAELGDGLRQPPLATTWDGEVLRSQYEAIFLVLGICRHRRLDSAVRNSRRPLGFCLPNPPRKRLPLRGFDACRRTIFRPLSSGGRGLARHQVAAPAATCLADGFARYVKDDGARAVGATDDGQ